MGNSGTINGTVTDPSGAAVAGATIAIKNVVSGYSKSTTADGNGAFRFSDVPMNNYHVTVSAGGFQTLQQDVSVRNSVAINLPAVLKIGEKTTSIDVTTDIGDVLENIPTSHVDIDSSTFNKLPTSQTSGLSDAITLATPGVVADSNGSFHPIGDHAETGFSVDNQPVTDQQSKLFSTSMPLNAFQSMEVIAGAPPAEYGDKTSLVVNAITKSGLNAPKSYGSFTTQYGSYGTYGENFDWGIGTPKFGNFLVVNNVRSGRYLDSPEFAPQHDRGNNETYFDRLDYQPTELDTVHLNLFFSRAWFQTPNTYDQQTIGPGSAPADPHFQYRPRLGAYLWRQALRLRSIHFSGTMRCSISLPPTSTPTCPSTLSATAHAWQPRTSKADVSSVHGIHNIKAGVQVQHILSYRGLSIWGSPTQPLTRSALRRPAALLLPIRSC